MDQSSLAAGSSLSLSLNELETLHAYFKCIFVALEMEDENEIYETLSREAEALKLRTEATEERMETLQRKLSGTSLDVPVPPPRRSVATNDNNPYPSAPEIRFGNDLKSLSLS